MEYARIGLPTSSTGRFRLLIRCLQAETLLFCLKIIDLSSFAPVQFFGVTLSALGENFLLKALVGPLITRVLFC